ncbi:G beta-like protein [Laccaria bicolor S238N-H82]|uniref:G beta-like protein n=1 Tax=Laccaria bicolor (strain S238N-H82 / ATCC MYA-4686) TaxID=486041 RepID=B0CTJ5_LACBS|nr:G beta-like protein [Laccaria bicolor S238N-H82]EDR13935.1 G beta-like protein [Laccaria bicolor S238N-H82]|eukprot:XP_001874494.1 G beta-like protein [Laccaria bicolor S238N-H82]
MNSTTIPTCKQTLTRHTNAINTLQISQDGSRLLSRGDDCLVIVQANRRQITQTHTPAHGNSGRTRCCTCN